MPRWMRLCSCGGLAQFKPTLVIPLLDHDSMIVDFDRGVCLECADRFAPEHFMPTKEVFAAGTEFLEAGLPIKWLKESRVIYTPVGLLSWDPERGRRRAHLDVSDPLPDLYRWSNSSLFGDQPPE